MNNDIVDDKIKSLPNIRVESAKEALDNIKVLDEVFEDFKTPLDIIVHRRVGVQALGFELDSFGKNPLKDAILKPGGPDMSKINEILDLEEMKTNLFHEKGYLSTSFSDDYTGVTAFIKAPIHFEITVPKGTRAMTITKHFFDAAKDGEKELLIDRGYKLKTTDVKVSYFQDAGHYKLLIKQELVPNHKNSSSEKR